MAKDVISIDAYRAKTSTDKGAQKPAQGKIDRPYTDDESWKVLSSAASEDSGTEESWSPADYGINIFSRGSMVNNGILEPDVYRLHLELIPVGAYGERLSTADFLRDADDRAEFLRLSKAGSSISRDILVPSDMNLHALHYVIQQAFGWQNRHLHSFRLLEDDFNRVTAGRVGGYMDLCGIIFRGSDDSTDDLCWDDDYDESRDFRRWIRKKYKRPFVDYAVSDTRYECMRFVEWFMSAHSDIGRDARLRLSKVYPCLDLIEGLTLAEIFTKVPCCRWSNDRLRDWKDDAVEANEVMQDILEDIAKSVLKEAEGIEVSTEEVRARLNEKLDSLIKCRETLRSIMRGISEDEQTGSDENSRYIQNVTGMKAGMARIMYSSYEKIMTENCKPLFEGRVRPLPFVEELLYQYDFGDNWWVRISCTDMYYENDEGGECDEDICEFDPDDEELDEDEISDCDGESHDEEADAQSCGAAEENWKKSDRPVTFFRSVAEDVVPPELDAMLISINMDGKPVCVAADGLNVMDDAGGLGGYYEFLKTANGKDRSAKAEARAWAKEMGWTGRMRNPENIL